MYYADPWDEVPRLEDLLDSDLPDHEQPVVAVDRVRRVEHPVLHHPAPMVRMDQPARPKENRLH